MIFYHGTTKEAWAEIQREGVLWGRRWITDNNGTRIKEVDRCTYLALDLEEAKCYGDTVLQKEKVTTIKQMEEILYELDKD